MTDKVWLNNNDYSPLNIICDFDGTISPFDSTDMVLSRFAIPQWEEVEAQWVAGQITAQECMSQQISMLRTDEQLLNRFLDTIPLTKGFEEFVAFVENCGIGLKIVSDGLDYVICRVLANHGLHDIPFMANHLKFTDNGFVLEFPHSRPNCISGVCKCAVAANVCGKTILIGDGRSDHCLANKAELVLAKSGQSLERHCHKNGLPYASYNIFYDVISFFEKNFNKLCFNGFNQNLPQSGHAPKAL